MGSVYATLNINIAVSYEMKGEYSLDGLGEPCEHLVQDSQDLARPLEEALSNAIGDSGWDKATWESEWSFEVEEANSDEDD